jgi:hypothetical protein
MYTYTVKSLRDEVRRFELNPEQARKRLTEVRDLISLLLDCKNDVVRIHSFKKLQRRLVLGWASFDFLLYWSKIANPQKE